MMGEPTNTLVILDRTMKDTPLLLSYIRQNCIFQKIPDMSWCGHIMQALERDVAGNDLLYNWPKDRSLFAVFAVGTVNVRTGVLFFLFK